MPEFIQYICYLGILGFGIVAGLGAVNEASASTEGVPLQVLVNVEKRLGPAELDGLRGVCVWDHYADREHPTVKAWERARFKYTRVLDLNCVRPSWQKQDGTVSLALDFGILDGILFACRQMKATPVFSIGGTPDILSSNPVLAIPDVVKSTTSASPSHYAPADYTAWREYVTQVIQHLVSKGYRGAYYEMLNEPEDFVSYWRGKAGSTDTLADYITHYIHTARAIKAADPAAKIGGPACAHWDSKAISGGIHAWGVPEFLRAIGKYRQEHPDENVPLDFISWHDYAMATRLLSDGVDLVDRTLAEVQWPTKPEYWITEWALGAESASSQERAAHVAWNILREAHPQTRRLTRLYYFVLDNGDSLGLIGEAPASPEADSSSRTPSNIVSPTYAVFEMLRDMNQGAYLEVNSENPIVALATMDERTLRLMVTNNTPQARSVLVEIINLPEDFHEALSRIQRVDAQHSGDGHGLEAGEKASRLVSGKKMVANLLLPAYGTVLATFEKK